MAHVVYVSVGMASTLHSSIELCRRLRQGGHRITFISHRDIGDQVGLSEFTFFHLSGYGEFNDRANSDPIPEHPLRNIPAFYRWFRRRRCLRLESIARTEIESLLEDLEPDLLLIDIECHFAVIATARLGLPTFLAMFFFSIFRQPGLPPLHSSKLPANTWHQELAARFLWWQSRLASRWQALVRQYGRRGLRAALRPVPYSTVNYADLRALARSRGYDLATQTDRSHWLRPYAYKQLPILCFNVWEMELPQPRHPHVHYVGPMINVERPEARLGQHTAETWAAFKRRRLQAPGTSRPLVYCSLGSYWSGDVAFLRRVVEVFVRRGDWDLVLGLGGKTKAEALAPVPANVLLLDWAPQMDVLMLADCAVTHGGVTTINECIHCEVPMVVYSTKHVDQNGNAARVVFHQLGVMGDKDSDSSRQIERHIDRCLSDPVILDSVSKMRRVFSDYRDKNEAVRLLEASAQGRGR